MDQTWETRLVIKTQTATLKDYSVILSGCLSYNDSSSTITKLERCINDIKAWSSANDLKLNEDKTEVIHVTSRFRKSSHLPFVNIADIPIQPVKSARNLGVIFKNDLRMDTYIKKYLSLCFLCFVQDRSYKKLS